VVTTPCASQYGLRPALAPGGSAAA